MWRRSLLFLAIFNAMGIWAAALIPNGSFEEASKDGSSFSAGWYYPVAITSEIARVEDLQMAHSGAGVLHFETGAACRALECHFTRDETAAGKYRLSFWARGRGNIMATLGYHDADGSFHPFNWPFSLDSGAEWKRLEGEWELKAGQRAVTMRLAISSPDASTSSIWIDDISFESASAALPTAPSLSLRDFSRIEVPIWNKGPRLAAANPSSDWSQGALVTGFTDLGRKFSTTQTLVRLGTDGEAFYCAFVSPVVTSMRNTAQHRDDEAVAGDDCVELWLLPPNEDKPYHLIVNSMGMIYDSHGDDITWNGAWEISQQLNLDKFRVSGEWRVEVRLPFREMGVSAPRPGEVWRARLCRTWGTTAGKTFTAQTSWPTIDTLGWKFTSEFGYLHFAAPRAPAGVSRYSGLDQGKLEIEGIGAPGDMLVVSLVGQADQRQIKEETRGVPASGAWVWSTALPVSQPLDLLCRIRVAAPDGVLRYDQTLPFHVEPAFKTELLRDFAKGELHISAKGLTAGQRLSVLLRNPEGQTVGRIESPAASEDGLSQCLIAIAGLPPRDNYLLMTTLLGLQGQPLTTKEQVLRIPPRPEWWDNTLGISQTVPRPWTPVTVSADGGAVEVWNREYRWNHQLLPQQFLQHGREVLLSPLRIVALGEDGRELPQTRLHQSLTVPSELAAAENGVAHLGEHLSLTIAGQVEFDGFQNETWTLSADAPQTLKALYVEIPVREGYAQYMWGQGNNGELFGALYGAPDRDVDLLDHWRYCPKGWRAGWENSWQWRVWVGGDDGGLDWVTDSEQFWTGPRYVTAEKVSGGWVIRLHLVDHPARLEPGRPWRYHFGWAVTPTKPLVEEYPAWMTRSGFAHPRIPNAPQDWQKEGMTGPFGATVRPGIPDLTEDFQKDQAATAQMGLPLRWMPYFATQDIASETQVFQDYCDTWQKKPLSFFWEQNGTRTAVCSAAPQRTNYFEWCVDQLFRVHHVGGLYQDCSTVSSCANREHGCGWVDRQGKVHPTIDVFTLRELFKRQFILAHSIDPGAILYLHSHQMQPAAIVSFVDVTLEGEQWDCSPSTFSYWNVTADMFRTGFSNHRAFGITWNHFLPALCCPWIQAKHDPLPDVYARAVIHDRGLYSFDEVNFFFDPRWDVLDRWRSHTDWTPWWKSASLAKPGSDDVKISVYTHKTGSGSLLVITNYSRLPFQGTITVDTAKLHCTTLRNPISGESWQNGSNKVSLTPMEFLLIEGQ